MRPREGGARVVVLSQPQQRAAELVVRRRVRLHRRDRPPEWFDRRCGVIGVEPGDADRGPRRGFPFARALETAALGFSGLLGSRVLRAGLLEHGRQRRVRAPRVGLQRDRAPQRIDRLGQLALRLEHRPERDVRVDKPRLGRDRRFKAALARSKSPSWKYSVPSAKCASARGWIASARCSAAIASFVRSTRFSTSARL